MEASWPLFNFLICLRGIENKPAEVIGRKNAVVEPFFASFLACGMLLNEYVHKYLPQVPASLICSPSTFASIKKALNVINPLCGDHLTFQ